MRRQAGVRTVATLLAVMSALASGCGWARYRGETQHTGTNPAEHAIGLAELPTLQTSWTTADRHFLWEPLVSGGLVFATTRVSIYAFDASTGAQRWRRSDLIAPHQVSQLAPSTTGAGAVYVTNTTRTTVTGAAPRSARRPRRRRGPSARSRVSR
jgi:outer membrane protein assembly factor BamB